MHVRRPHRTQAGLRPQGPCWRNLESQSFRRIHSGTMGVGVKNGPQGAPTPGADLFWSLRSLAWGWGLDHKQLQISKGPTHFCFHWVSPHITPSLPLISKLSHPQGCGDFVSFIFFFQFFPSGSPDKEANLYPLLLPLRAWRSFPMPRGMWPGASQ